MYDLIILGGGPAGVSAGIYAARKKLRTVLLTKNFGGQAVDSALIENFIGQTSISGIDFSKLLEKQLRVQEGIEIYDGVTIRAVEQNGDLWRVTDEKDRHYEARTLLITLGSAYRRLHVPGEKEFEGKGIFYCSICDAPLLKNKKAVVIGGGNSGLEAVIDLLPYATEIHLLEKMDRLKGDPVYQERIVKEEKVFIHKNVSVSRFVGSAFLEKVCYMENGSTQEKEFEAQGAFVSIGQVPNSDLFSSLLTRTPSGHIVVDPQTFQTSAQGVWAAGDITNVSYNQINTAIGDGIKAVLNIYETLQRKM